MFFKRLTILATILFLIISSQLMAKEHNKGEGKGHQKQGMYHQDQGKHKGHYKQDRQKYYKRYYRESYHHGHHKHYRMDHGHYVAYYVEGYNEHRCGNDAGWYDSHGSFFDLNMDSRGNASFRLNVDLDHH